MIELQPNTNKQSSVDSKIYEGDCLEIMPQWDDRHFDHCITDPPYNMSKRKGLGWTFSSHVTLEEDWDKFGSDEYIEFCHRWISEVSRLVKPNGNIITFGSFHNIYQIGFVLQQMDLKIVQHIVWFKPNAQPNITCRMFTESCEHILWACNNSTKDAKNWIFNYDVAKKLNGGKQMRNLWEIPLTPPRERSHGKHPSQKPFAVLERLILTCTNENDLILDCFSGSGTTAVAAETHRRRCVMIEKNPEYNIIAQERLRDVQVSLAIW